MSLASGIFKQVVIGEETTFGTASSETGQLLRRTQSTIDLTKDSYQSQEILPSQQVRDARHGIRRVPGNIRGELSPGAYPMLFEGLLRKAFASGGSATSVTANVSGNKITRSSGSWVTDGFRVGDVVRCTGFTGNAAANNDKNLRVVAVTATDLTVAETLASDSSASINVATPGKKTWVPGSGHVKKSYTIEHWFGDIGVSERFTGCRVGSVNIDMPPTGMTAVDFSLLGQDRAKASTRLFNNPNPAGTERILAASTGVLRVGTSDLAIVTGLRIQLDGNLSADPVAFSDVVPEVWQGRVIGSGQFSAYFDSATLSDAFDAEDELSIHFVLFSTSDDNAPFMSFYLPRVKLTGAQKDDNEKGLQQQVPFVMLEHPGATGIEPTTIVVQDSSL